MVEKRREKNVMAKKVAYTKNVLKGEIDELKESVRSAYSIEIRQNEQGYEPTAEELEIVEERSINLKLIERLEKLHNAQRMKQPSDGRAYVEMVPAEALMICQVFYLCRLAQQGFLYMISGTFPALEPQALTYLCDKLIGSSLYISRSETRKQRDLHRKHVRQILNHLYLESDIPVAEGFTTTYKLITSVIDTVVRQSLRQTEQPVSETVTEHKQPPVLMVMPYTSMLDFAMPGMVPTLPYPATLLPTGFMPKNVNKAFLPKPNPLNEINEMNRLANLPASVDEILKEKEEEKEEKEEEKQEQEEEEHDEYKTYYEDRFADPSDDDFEEEEVVEEKKEVETIKEEEKKQETTESNSGQFSDDTEETKEELAKANSSWLNFVAEDSSTTSSPRSPHHHRQKSHQK